MAWFKIDDGFHCHPKVFAAGTAAVGLYVRCGSWAAQQVTDGIVPKHVAKMYGTPRMIKALVDAGLWHQSGHDCESCPELDANSYAIHQYLDRNPSRVETEFARKAKTERQQRWRDGKKNAQDNGGDPSTVDVGVDASTPRHGDAVPTPSRPVPSQASPTEKPASYAREHDSPGRRGPTIPDFARDLVDHMTAAGMVVSWGLSEPEWFAIHAHIKRTSIEALVAYARQRWNPANPPNTARYLTRMWADMPSMPEPGTGVVPLAAAVGFTGQQPVSRLDQKIAAGLELARRLEAEENNR